MTQLDVVVEAVVSPPHHEGDQYDATLYKPEAPGQSFAAITFSGADLQKILCGQRFTLRLVLWEFPQQCLCGEAGSHHAIHRRM